jgi:PIN domain
LPQPVCRDPDDDQVLALAIAAKVDLIVSGDNDLLSLGSFEGVPIIAPAQAVTFVEATSSGVGRQKARPDPVLDPVLMTPFSRARAASSSSQARG